MPIRLKIQFPDFRDLMKQLGQDAATAQTRAMADVVAGWKGEIRPLVKANFQRTPPYARARGLNYEKSFQGSSYPSKGKVSADPAGFLIAKADFAQVFEDGGSSRPKSRRYLAIPLAGAKKLGLDYGPSKSNRLSKRSLVEEAERRFGALRPIRSKAGNTILAADTHGKAKGGFLGTVLGGKVKIAKARGKKRDFVPLFVLVRSVRLPKKLNFVALAQKWLNRLPDFTEKRAAELLAKRK